MLRSDYEACLEHLTALVGTQTALEEAVTAMNTVEDSPGFATTEPFEATDHQKDLLDAFQKLGETQGAAVVVGKRSAAVESNEEDPSPVSRAVIALFKGAMENTIDLASESFDRNKSLFHHYSRLALGAKKKAEGLLKRIQETQVPLNLNDFETGAFSRFFHIAGQPVDSIPAFTDALAHQETALEYCGTYGLSYYRDTTKVILNAMGLMTKKADSGYEEDFKDTYASITQQWKDVWFDVRHEPVTRATSWSKQSYSATLGSLRPECNYQVVAPLLDSRFLVSYAPKSKTPDEPGAMAVHLGFFGADVVQEQQPASGIVRSVAVGTAADLISMLKITIRMCDIVIAYESQSVAAAKKAADFKEAAKALKKAMVNVTFTDELKYMSLYLKMVHSLTLNLTQPHVNVCWSSVRAILMSLSLAEHFILPETEQTTFQKLKPKEEQVAIVPAVKAQEKALSFFDRITALFKRS